MDTDEPIDNSCFRLCSVIPSLNFSPAFSEQVKKQSPFTSGQNISGCSLGFF